MSTRSESFLTLLKYFQKVIVNSTSWGQLLICGRRQGRVEKTTRVFYKKKNFIYEEKLVSTVVNSLFS